MTMSFESLISRTTPPVSRTTPPVRAEVSKPPLLGWGRPFDTSGRTDVELRAAFLPSRELS